MTRYAACRRANDRPADRPARFPEICGEFCTAWKYAFKNKRETEAERRRDESCTVPGIIRGYILLVRYLVPGILFYCCIVPGIIDLVAREPRSPQLGRHREEMPPPVTDSFHRAFTRREEGGSHNLTAESSVKKLLQLYADVFIYVYGFL